MSDQVLDALAALLQEKMQVKHDLPSGFSLTDNFMHGPNGIFSTPGLEQAVFSTVVKPQGLLEQIPFVATRYTHPITQLLTGFTDETGDEASAVCDDCVQAGEIKGCRQGTVFGRICRETTPIELNKIGQLVNRSELTDLVLVNSPLLQGNLMSMPTGIPRDVQSALNNEVVARWQTLGMSFLRKLSVLLYTGNPANGNGGGYEEYNGLERLVKTGHVDVIDNDIECPSLDSDVKDANYTSVNDNALLIYQLMQQIYRYVSFNADMMGFTPVRWAWVMNDSLFRMLTDYWPCVYATGRCYGNTNYPSSNVDAMAMVQMADAMYRGKYLRIDGIDMPVITDNVLPYEYNGDANQADHGLQPGEFASDIYLLPFTVRGSQQVLFMEYFDYRASMAQAAFGRLSNEYWTDGGAWLWTFSKTNWCLNWKAKIEPRLRLKTPHLAGRLQNVKWVPIQKTRDPLPDQPYFTNGGFTTLSNAPYTLRSQ